MVWIEEDNEYTDLIEFWLAERWEQNNANNPDDPETLPFYEAFRRALYAEGLRLAKLENATPNAGR